MSQAERYGSKPTYRMDAILERLSAHIEPYVNTVIQTARPIIEPIQRRALEIRNLLPPHEKINQRALQIELFANSFNRKQNKSKGEELMKRGLFALHNSLDFDNVKNPSLEREIMWKAQQDTMDPQQIMYEIERWAPELELNDSLMNPTYQENIKDKMREVIQNMVSGYLFDRNRALFEGGGKKLDEEKAKRQMKGVASMLTGHHIHMGTGEGKTTVALPITAITESLTSKKRDVLLATASDEKVEELYQHVNTLSSELPRGVRVQLQRQDQDPLIKDHDVEKEIIHKKMLQSALLKDVYSGELCQEISTVYWKNKMKGVMTKDRMDMLNKADNTSRILLTSERDVVFAYAEDPKQFVAKAPTLLMDEGDIPYRRQTPYDISSDDLYHTPEEMRESVGNWLLHHIVSWQLKYDEGDFEPTEGGFKLTKDAEKRLRRLPLHRLIEHPDSPGALRTSFKKGVFEISKYLGITDKNEINKMEKTMIKWFKTYLPPRMAEPQEEGITIPQDEVITPLQSLVVTIAERLGNQFWENGSGYLMREGGNIMARDAYIDDILEGHRHDPETEYAILAVNNKFRFVSPVRTTGRRVHFQTLVVDMKEKIICASGSLMYPDLLTGAISKDVFGLFLEEATGNEVILITPPEVKQAPQPHLFKSDEQAINKLVDDVGSRDQPRLVICYDRIEGDALLARFKKQYPGKKVMYVSEHPTQKQVSQLCRGLAEGKIDILISAGNFGFGVNIVERNGTYPNLHVSLYGLPMNQLQVTQALGRRRAEGNDFSWYIPESHIYRKIANFKGDISWLEKHIQGFLSVEQMMEGYKEAFEDKDMRLVFITDLLRQQEISQRSNDMYITHFDAVMGRLRKHAFVRLEKKILEDLKKMKQQYQNEHILQTQIASQLEYFEGPVTRGIEEDNLIKKIRWIEKNIHQVVNLFGLPADMDDEMSRQYMLCPVRGSNLRDSIEAKFPTYLSEGTPSKLGEYVSEWYEGRAANVEAFLPLITDNYKLKKVFPVQMMQLQGPLQASATFIPIQGSGFGYLQVKNDIPALLGRQFGGVTQIVNSWQGPGIGFAPETGAYHNLGIEVTPLTGDGLIGILTTKEK